MRFAPPDAFFDVAVPASQLVHILPQFNNGATMGVNLDYPTGKPDTAEYAERGFNSSRWHSLPVGGNNFPDAFMGTMGALQSFHGLKCIFGGDTVSF